MKTVLYQKEKKEEGNIKKYFDVILLVFTLTIITVILILSKLDEISEEQMKNSTDYVSVFKESELYNVLFPEENEN